MKRRYAKSGWRVVNDCQREILKAGAFGEALQLAAHLDMICPLAGPHHVQRVPMASLGRSAA